MDIIELIKSCGFDYVLCSYSKSYYVKSILDIEIIIYEQKKNIIIKINDVTVKQFPTHELTRETLLVAVEEAKYNYIHGEYVEKKRNQAVNLYRSSC
jgi:hypothetical protein